MEFLDTTFLAEADAIRELHPATCNDLESELYAIPVPLLDALASAAPKLIPARELEAEYSFTRSLHRHHAIGVRASRVFRCSLLNKREPVIVSQEAFDNLGWKQLGWTLEDANRMCRLGEQRAVPFHDQLCAYAGWLVTNTVFLAEVSQFKLCNFDPVGVLYDAAQTNDQLIAFKVFLDRWQLDRLASWDLPEPRGPNLAGIDPPNAAERMPPSVDLRFPLTASVPARLDLREIVTEIRREESNRHLHEWQEILDRSGKSAIGIQRFKRILQIRFYRDIVLTSRYGDRFDGNVQAIDRALGQFLGHVSEDTVKLLRREIQRRLQLPADTLSSEP